MSVDMVLEIVGGPAAGRVTQLSAGESVVVGRGKNADLRIREDKAISRRHFVVDSTEGGWCLVDLGSVNGTDIDGKRVDERAPLTDGARITAGQTELRVSLIGLEPADEPQTQFPGYRTTRPIGEGNMGSVYLVERLSDSKTFAVKSLHADVALSDTDAERFMREARSLRALDHPNIVGFVDSGLVDNEFFFVMDYVEGVDLDIYRRQAGGKVRPERAVDVIAQILDGLDYAHAQGFVHRDVKPANILVGTQGGRMVAKLTDFGLAKRFEAAGNDAITRGAISFGTPDYMPPEQITDFKGIGPLGDIYAVGATLYHLLSGRTVYAGVGGKDPIRTLMEESPIPLERRAPHVPAALARAVGRALERRPEDRWRTAGEFRTALLRARP